jgi:hypothetical protein
LNLTQKLGERGHFAKVSLARLGLIGALAQVSVGWKEIYAVVERFPYIEIQMHLLWNSKDNLLTYGKLSFKICITYPGSISGGFHP